MKQIFPLVKNLYINLRIKYKMFILISLIVIISFSSTQIILQYAYNIYDEQIYEKSAQVLSLSSTVIESELKKIEKLSFNIIADERIQSDLKKLNGDLSEYERFRIRTKLLEKLFGYAGSEKNILSIHLFGLKGEEYSAGVKTISTPAGKREQIIADSAKGRGTIRWIYPDDTDFSLIAAREVRSFTNLSLDKLGTLIIRIDIEKIVKDHAKGSEKLHGGLIVASGKEIIFPQNPFLSEAQISLLSKFPQGYRTEEINGEQYFIAHIQSDNTNWTYLNVFPFRQIFERILVMKNFVILVFIMIFAVVSAWGMNFAKSLTDPIEHLISKMRLVQKGDFHKASTDLLSPASLQKDEVGQLYRNFGIMVQQINHLISENYAKQLTIKETEFKALQAQINPHFLYNTLESINWLAKMNRQPQISQMVEALGFLLRSSISLKEPLITVGEEIEIIHNYITIQKFRFEERLDFHLQVPQEIKDNQIPKLTLQPLLENAIHYALEPMVSPCKITIRAEDTPKNLMLIVEDNGPGMDPGFLEKVQQGEVRSKGNGVGLKNIDERIKLAFGEPYGIRLSSEPGRGTSVSVVLPHQKG
ncbi:sensor histidine kinase [Paenactinomyces guangxiensis]|uniref:histidine kinase n=1 Tax=Paenactinomyces guangxiensis TaxID=1490290 RepID=A0A7W1WPN6_9BACL|nr:sensor histidine kinase [Paenactinomyces guangxiensis]MBA4493779.1 sensor histidine kinase [Paenactinomyces guangxiensis]MBH8591068.1 sensor histidine kinase [Paenactinomyces guangxiensis]